MKNIGKKYKELMESLAVILSDSLSSMTMFWIISLLVIIPLFFTQPVGLVGWMQYIVSVFFQGVALPVLGYTAKIGGERTDAIIKKIEELSERIDRQTAEIGHEVDEIVEDIGIEGVKIEEDIDKEGDDISTDLGNKGEKIVHKIEKVGQEVLKNIKENE
jgi:hypothetical protein